MDPPFENIPGRRLDPANKRITIDPPFENIPGRRPDLL